jgi:hypothetical protein
MRSSAVGERAAAAGLVFQSGYLGVIRAHFLRPFISVEHPGATRSKLEHAGRSAEVE